MISVFSFWQLSAVFESYWVLCTCKSVFVDANMITFRVLLVKSGPAYGQEWLLWGRVCVAEPHPGLTYHSWTAFSNHLLFSYYTLLSWVVRFDCELIYFQLWKRFRGNDKPPAHLGSSRDYNVDMIPKVYFQLCFTTLLLSDQLFCFWTCHFLISTLLSMCLYMASLWWQMEILYVSSFILMLPSTCTSKLWMAATSSTRERYTYVQAQ